MGRFTDLFQHSDAAPAPAPKAEAPAPEVKKTAKTTKKK